ncbi:hypothetical protein [Pseudanabaena sp. PCC 6802]|uniref:hypothetical protein n=1 Tax=Pseudanabaena sp. PCC 6802 TaxID=118173 RepID=UPI000349012A|nr:hypothetical protein [Pseudanabaena sp. PCC 6802]
MKAIEVSFWLPKVLLASCLLLTACTANSQQVSQAQTPKEVRSEVAAATKSKQELAREVLTEFGIAQRYDLHFMGIVDMGVGPTSRPKFYTWLHQVLVQGAGWKRTEAKYVARLESDFTEAELQELLSLAKRPLFKKLLKAEFQAYDDVTPDRRKLLNQVWDDYNSGKIDAPPDILK